MTALRIFPWPCEQVDLGEIYRDIEFPEGEPYVVLNMVSTVDGRAAVHGKAHPIGSELDHMLMRRIRAGADAVMVGAGTVRKEGVDLTVPEGLATEREARDRSPQPLGVVVTSSGQLPWERRALQASRGAMILFGPEGMDVPPEISREVITHAVPTYDSRGHLDMHTVLRTLLREYGVTRLVVEGGPTLNYSLLRAGLVHELFMTLAPKIAGGADVLPIVLGNSPTDQILAALQLLSIYEHDSELYLRYAVTQSAER